MCNRQMTIVQSCRVELRDVSTEAFTRAGRHIDRGARSSRSPDLHGACNTVLSALVVHDRYRDNKKALRNDFSEHFQTRTPERGQGADRACSPVSVTSLKTPVTDLRLRRKRRLGNHDFDLHADRQAFASEEEEEM